MMATHDSTTFNPNHPATRADRARAEFVLGDFEEWAGFEATGEGWQRIEAIADADLALIAAYGLDDGAAFDALVDRLGSDAAVYIAHPELCPDCGGHGAVETRPVVGTWASWNGPQLDVDDVPCRTCRAELWERY